MKRYTPVPPITASAAETEDPELRQEMKEWRQRMKFLKDAKDYEDAVKHCAAFSHSVYSRFQQTPSTSFVIILCNAQLPKPF